MIALGRRRTASRVRYAHMYLVGPRKLVGTQLASRCDLRQNPCAAAQPVLESSVPERILQFFVIRWVL